MLPQWQSQSTSMTTKHDNDYKTQQWPQLPKLQHTTCKNQKENTKNLQAQKLKMGMIKIDLQVATFKKYEFELKTSRCKDATSCWALIFAFKLLRIIGY
jgi:hypothetical protein